VAAGVFALTSSFLFIAFSANKAILYQRISVPRYY
jgi:hypothetical protein